MEVMVISVGKGYNLLFNSSTYSTNVYWPLSYLYQIATQGRKHWSIFFQRDKHLWSSSLVSCGLLWESQQFKCGPPFSPLCWDLCSKEILRISRHGHQHSGCGLWQNRKRQGELRKLRGSSPWECSGGSDSRNTVKPPMSQHRSHFFNLHLWWVLGASSLFGNSTRRDARLFTLYLTQCKLSCLTT